MCSFWSFFYFLFFWLPGVACGILVPWPGVEPGSSAVTGRCPNPWATTGSLKCTSWSPHIHKVILGVGTWGSNYFSCCSPLGSDNHSVAFYAYKAPRLLGYPGHSWLCLVPGVMADSATCHSQKCPGAATWNPEPQASGVVTLSMFK